MAGRIAYLMIATLTSDPQSRSSQSHALHDDRAYAPLFGVSLRRGFTDVQRHWCTVKLHRDSSRNEDKQLERECARSSWISMAMFLLVQLLLAEQAQQLRSRHLYLTSEPLPL